jgi:hypothetical protein
MKPLDECSDRDMVKSLGWIVTTSPLYGPLGDRWLVFLSRGEHRIMARASSLQVAWALAAGMVEQLDEHGE